MKLTKEEIDERDRRVIEYIVGFKVESGGVGPTLVEIGAAIGLKSKSHIHYWITDMEKRGKLSRILNSDGKGADRGISIPGERYIAP